MVDPAQPLDTQSVPIAVVVTPCFKIPVIVEASSDQQLRFDALAQTPKRAQRLAYAARCGQAASVDYARNSVRQGGGSCHEIRCARVVRQRNRRLPAAKQLHQLVVDGNYAVGARHGDAEEQLHQRSCQRPLQLSLHRYIVFVAVPHYRPSGQRSQKQRICERVDFVAVQQVVAASQRGAEEP